MNGGTGSERKWKAQITLEQIVQRGAPALLFLAGGFFVALLLQPVVPHSYVLVLLLATAACGWMGRRSVGTAAGLVAAIGAEYLFLEPAGSFRLDPGQFVEAALFGCSAILTGWVTGSWSGTAEDLRKSRDQFRVLLDGVKEYAVFLLDPAGRVTTWNAGAQRLKGYAAEEILGKPTSIFYVSEDVKDRLPQKLLSLAAERGSAKAEGWRQRKDGTRFWAEVTINALFEDSGAIKGYAKMTRDVTELKKSQEALKAKEEELRVVVESAPDGVVVTDERGTIVFVNGRAEKMFGYNREELIGKKVEVLVPAKVRGSHVGHRAGYQQKPYMRPMGLGLDLDGLRKDGSQFPVEISISPTESGPERRILASVRDISERRKVEQELQHSKIQDLAQIMTRDLDGKILRWNDGMRRVYGYTREEAEGQDSHKLLKTEFPQLLESIEAQLLRSGFWEGELVHRTKEGKKVIVTSNWMLHRDQEGKPCRVLESSTDVTALKEEEAKTRELNLVLKQQNSDLSKAKALIESQTEKIALAAKMSALGEMAGGMAHEINNPMGIIHARASDLMEIARESESVRSEVVIATMERIRNTASRVTKITQGLRKFARETHNDPATETKVREILEDTLPFCTERLRQHEVTLRLVPVDEGLLVKCRPTEISQVLLNLLNNAVDAVQPLQEKWIELQAKSMGADVEISVTDSGNGIPETLRNRVGQPFFTTKVVGQGTGLGLSISKGIVEAHGGKFFVDTECSHTRFVITLPKALASKEEPLAIAK